MYLKRLEIHGFKSFADKISLDFNQGLSVIVGPNGSGKSNISDAIRWVIGEQSAKSLRGTKMEDVIFVGSAKRRPVGMAEVSLTLDNSTGIFPLAYNEITVTRRVYRSGESEYLLNKSPCRLKDVQELFMDTGIGRDGISIIGQGRVEEILNAKPEERRGLIEEVAGITKYRNRKKEAARKLADTEQNLIRLADIINELESRLDPLQEQAARAEQYQGLKMELDRLELNLIVHDTNELNTKLSTCRAQIKELQDQVLGAETGLRVREAEIAELKLALQSLDEQIYQGQSHCHNLASQIQQLESEIKLCGERTGSIVEQQQRLSLAVVEAEQKSNSLRAEYQAEEAKLLILRRTREELDQKLRAKEQELARFGRELGSAEGQIEILKAEAFEALSTVAKHNNELAALHQQVEGLNYRLQVLTSQKSIKSGELGEVRTKLTEVAAQLARGEKQLAGLLAQLNDTKTEEEQLKIRRNTLAREAESLKERLQTSRSRLKILQDMQRDFEGYNRGVKEVLLAATQSRLTGICGVVAELLQVPARLETAVEVALGSSLQNLVTLTEQDAKKAIAYLKNNHFGRATFLPLDALQPGNRNFDHKVLHAPGVLGVAADLVKAEAQYRPVVEYLLGRILVVENLDQAVHVARLGGYRLRIVTLEGELLSPGGSMTGGSLQQRSHNLLGRSREISQLEALGTELAQQLKVLQAEEGQLVVRLGNLEQTMSHTQALIKDAELTLATLVNRRGNLQQEEVRLQRELDQANLEYGQIEEQLAQLEVQKLTLQSQRDKHQEAYDRLSEEVARAQESLKDQGTAREQLQIGISELKVEIASLEQQEKGLQSVLARYYQQQREFQAAAKERDKELAALTERKLSIEREVVRLQEDLAVLTQTERQAQGELVAVREEREGKAAVLKKKEEEIKTQRAQLQSGQESLHSAQVREARLEAEITSALTRLQENLGLDLEEAVRRSQPLDNRRETVLKINKLKGQLSLLGAVNLAAIEEFAQVKERHAFLFAQQQDLLQAKASLFNVIAEMDRIMVERFAQSFKEIKEQFAAVFAELFGGGRAELELTDPDSLLETGVEIIAQPPGKKLQHLSLLSGGEKALTAIALLFAMLKTKPSPFCVLDEIEAALDEANVNRFAAYLRELTATNQFIVISHRKGTMEAADVLYGVTMEENGVSKLYSVKMADMGEETRAG